MDLLESRNGNLQHNAAFALYGLADNEDNIADIVRDGEQSAHFNIIDGMSGTPQMHHPLPQHHVPSRLIPEWQ